MSIYGAQTLDAPLYDDAAKRYDAILFLSFGGPEGPDEVMPFLEHVTAGRNVPRERLEEVAGHYLHYGGVSPINAQNRALIAALREELDAHGLADLPIYFGNRNSEPFVGETVRQMEEDGVRSGLVFVTSAFSTWSGCRQYREDVFRALEGIDHRIAFDKIRVFYNHPGFVEPMADNVRAALDRFPAERQDGVEVVFTAHSIPLSMAAGSAYERQLDESCRLVAERAGTPTWRLVYQSRSGSPRIPWLEPDIVAALDTLHGEGRDDVIVVPIGFISDHMEVLFDLDDEAKEHAIKLSMHMERAATVGTDPRFVSMIRELIVERMTADPERRALGTIGPNHDICPLDCCQLGTGPERITMRRPA
ncbi:MAG TPA: ferrochelatase [Thermomicrobiales bacterium]|jgi:ferrochelatase|nr:ferrochelatase [Thermomicrobiales bacterium]